jgi:hypothetical protein
MFKFLGTTLALAAGAGAVYYWWSHNHGDMQDEFRDMGDHFKDTGKHVTDTLKDH